MNLYKALTLLDRVELRGGRRQNVDRDAPVPQVLSGLLVAVDGGSIHDDDSPGGMSRVVEQGLHEFEVVVAYTKKEMSESVKGVS